MIVNFWRMLFALVAFFWIGAAAGCSLFNQHAQMMDAVRGLAQEAGSRLSEQGWGQTQASASAINPGITIEAGLKYYATARYEGLAGQLASAQQGQLSRAVPQDVQDRINAVYRQTNLPAEQRLKLLRDILSEHGIATSQPAQ